MRDKKIEDVLQEGLELSQVKGLGDVELFLSCSRALYDTRADQPVLCEI